MNLFKDDEIQALLV